MTRINRKLRIAVARDVLKQIRLERYIASHVYVDLVGLETLEYDSDTETNDYTASFQKVFQKNKELKCNVCALGSAFMSLVNLKNECSVDDIVNGTDDMFERLRDLYGSENMSYMESAFEGGACHNGGDVGDDVLEAAGEWGKQESDDTQRLRKIMLNIIRNNGDFKLPKRFVDRFMKQRQKNEAQLTDWA